jgi:hypothetical protein
VTARPSRGTVVGMTPAHRQRGGRRHAAPMLVRPSIEPKESPMPTRAVLSSRSAGIPARALVTLTVLAVALSVAFVLAPSVLAASTSSVGFANQPALIHNVSTAFVKYLNAGHREFPPNLASTVEYWSHYHLAKAAIAGVLLIVFAALGVLPWREFLGGGGLGTSRRIALTSSGALAVVFAVMSLVIVVVNIRGAVVPFSSLLSMLPVNAPDAQLADTLDQVRQRLTDYPSGQTSPALAAMISDFARYHAAMVVATGIVTIVLVGTSVAAWRWFAATYSSDRRTRHVSGSLGVLSAVLSLAVIVVAMANLTTATNPVPALLAFFNGGS